MDLEVKTFNQRLAELQQDVAQKKELAAAVSAHQEALAHLQGELQSAQQSLEQLRQRQNALEPQVSGRTMWPVVCNRCNTNYSKWTSN